MTSACSVAGPIVIESKVALLVTTFVIADEMSDCVAYTSVPGTDSTRAVNFPLSGPNAATSTLCETHVTSEVITLFVQLRLPKLSAVILLLVR